MLAIDRKKKNALPLIIGAALLLLVLALFIAWRVFQSSEQKMQPSTTQNDTTQTQVETSSAEVAEVIPTSQEPTKADLLNPPAPPSPATSATMNITITRVNQTTSGTVAIRAFAQGVTSGTCEFTLTKDSATVTRAASLSLDTTSYVCEPIDIPLSEFPSKGTWQLNARVVSGAEASPSVTSTVSIQ